MPNHASLAGIVLLSSLMACATEPRSAPTAHAGEPPGESTRWISLMKLIVQPEDYVGSTVVVRGFLGSIGGTVRGSSDLFVTREYAEMDDELSAVWVVDEDGDIRRQCGGQRYVQVEGRFERRPEIFTSYMITDVARVWTLRDGIDEQCFPGK